MDGPRLKAPERPELAGQDTLQGALSGRARRLAAEYVQYQYSSGYLKLLKHLRGLPREESRLTWSGLAIVAILLAATAAIVATAPRLSGISFEDVTGTGQSVPVAAVVLSLAAFALAWACLLTGSAGGPGVVWVVVGLLFVYSFIVIGLAVGRSWLHLFALGLPLAVGALTPGSRRWANVALALAIASIAIRLSPLPQSVRMVWYLPWLPVAAALVWLQYVVARRARLSAVQRTTVAAGVLLAYLCVIGVRAAPRGVTEAFHVSLNNAIGFLELLWFLLGASFVGGAIALGQFAQKVVEATVSGAALLWLLPVAWVGVVAWLVGVPLEPAWARTAGVALLGAAVVALVARWWMRGMSRQWMAGWFVASIAALGVLRAYVTTDLGDVVTREAGLVSLVAFIYAVVWEVVGRIPDVPLETPHFARPSPLLILLGVVLVMAAAALFGFAANLRFFQQVVVFAQYRGALALWIPVVVLTLIDARRVVPDGARGRFTAAFMVGAAVGVPVFVVRALMGPEAGNWLALVAAASLALWLTVRWPQATTPLGAAGVAGAAAFGSAVSVSSRAFVMLVPPLLTMAAALGGPNMLRQAAEAVSGWTTSTGWGPRDQLVNFLVTPLVAIALAAGAATLRSRAAEPALSGGRS